jgi:peptidoglycan/xylan/chitin deacetylase (PgdA/CDA1 family)
VALIVRAGNPGAVNPRADGPGIGVPVLAYHANNVTDDSYAGNDHRALATDLRLLHEAGWRCVTLDAVLDWQEGQGTADALERCFAVTFDDGSDFDFRDIDHPTCGLQRSLFNVLGDFSGATGAPASAASFVIASPDARVRLDERCLVGRGWWNDDWWAEANASGVLTIECHGWDHLHPVLDEVAQRDGLAGDFRRVDTLEDCRRQLRDAASLIARLAGGRRPRCFAYPWGQYSDYLVQDYLPSRREEHGFRAAFTTGPGVVRRSQDRWRLPRLVCGEAWRSPEELLSLLVDAQAPA